MAKTGRNDPCPCGSGKKYKRCCLTKDEEAERALAAVAQAPLWQISDSAADIPDADDEDTWYALATASNAAAELVLDGRLDEAEQAALDLLERFPEMHDGWDRLGMVYEARGDHRQAAECYRKVIDFICAHPENYDPGFEAIFRKLVDRLDPSPSA
jgi:tetratricopeptide (TPR) repeat protein